MTNTNTMTNTNSDAAIESLRTFALANGELQFAHMCTAALSGEGWAIERIADTQRRVAEAAEYRDAEQEPLRLSAIRSTDTTRPDGAIARSFQV